MDAISTPPPHSIFQPLFHVRHGVGGSEQAPLNLWSIVFLTDAPDPRYCEPFEQMVRAGLLPGFIEIYIERDLKLKLEQISLGMNRRDSQALVNERVCPP